MEEQESFAGCPSLEWLSAFHPLVSTPIRQYCNRRPLCCSGRCQRPLGDAGSASAAGMPYTVKNSLLSLSLDKRTRHLKADFALPSHAQAYSYRALTLETEDRTALAPAYNGTDCHIVAKMRCSHCAPDTAISPAGRLYTIP